MDEKNAQAHELIVRAREALRRGDKSTAQDLGEKAALLAPDMEDAWLVLAAADPNPQDALAYAKKALELNPKSRRAHQAVAWTSGLVKQAPAESEAFSTKGKNPKPGSKSPQKRMWWYAIILVLLVCVVFVATAWSAFSNPAFAFFTTSEPTPTQEDHWALMDIPKPSVTPVDVRVFASTQPTDTPALLPTESVEPTEPPPTAAPLEESSLPTEGPLAPVTETAAPMPEATETPGVMTMEIVVDPKSGEFIPPNPDAPKPKVASKGDTHWVDVDLGNQRLYAYEGETMVKWFAVSTGTLFTPTVTGEYKVYVKYLKANMRGPGYFLPDVPYVMYFYKDYGLHGTYWHSNFGTPMSHGCVNLRTEDAAWLYEWASVGTVVNVHD